MTTTGNKNNFFLNIAADTITQGVGAFVARHDPLQFILLTYDPCLELLLVLRPLTVKLFCCACTSQKDCFYQNSKNTYL